MNDASLCDEASYVSSHGLVDRLYLLTRNAFNLYNWGSQTFLFEVTEGLGLLTYHHHLIISCDFLAGEHLSFVMGLCGTCWSCP